MTFVKLLLAVAFIAGHPSATFRVRVGRPICVHIRVQVVLEDLEADIVFSTRQLAPRVVRESNLTVFKDLLFVVRVALALFLVSVIMMLRWGFVVIVLNILLSVL